MAYNFRNRLDHVGNRMYVINPERVTYIRGGDGGDEIPGIIATPARTDNQEIIPKAGITNIRNQDWIFRTIDLVYDAEAFEPDYGDEVIRANGERYRVCAFRASTLENEAPFGYVTSKRTRIRVHTEQIS